MQWFKRWYHEKFVSRTSYGTDITLPANVNEAKTKRKVIRIIYDGCCNCNDDSIVCSHRRNKSYWFIQRQLFHRSIDSIVTGGVSVGAGGGDKNENNNFESRTAIEATELVQTTRGENTQVTDNSIEHAISHINIADNHGNISSNVHSTDIDVSDCRSLDGSRGNFQSTKISSVTDVNIYGNGERSGSLSKSKEPRLRTFKLSIVPKINCSICNQNQQHQQDPHYHHPSVDIKTSYNDSISNRIQIQYDDGIADTDEWPPKPFQQIDFLQRRIKELEYFISEIENRVRSDESVSSGSSSNSICSDITSSDTNLSNAQCRYCDEQPLTDWVIVSIELRSITKCENFPCDDHLSSSGKESSSTSTTTSTSASASAAFVQYYTTSEISDKRTIITVHQYQSNCTLSDRKLSSQTDYGHNCTVGRLLCICKLLNFNNIQTGTPSIDQQHLATEVATLSTPSTCQHQYQQQHQHNEEFQSTSSTMKFSSVATSLARDFHSTDSFFHKDPMYPEFNYLMQEPCTSSKHSNMLTAQMIHTSFSSASSTIDSPKLVSPFTTPIKFCSTESIPEYFGLNECGDIIIHVDHICEETGFGFLVGRKKKIYCDVPYGEEVYEKPKFSIKCAVKRIFKAMSDTICKCTSSVGHPRNKTTTNGPGDSIAAYALSLAQDPESTFSRNIENFISCTKDSRETSPQIIMRNMRQFMSGMKNYLVKHGEGDFQQEVLRARSMLKPDEFLNLDTILEGVMHQLVVLPLREHLYNLFVDYYKSTGDIQLLAENVKAAVGKTPTDFGIRPCIQTPSPTAMQRISLLILRLQEAELPLAKLDLLLSIVTSIIESTANTQSHALGADDFLPLLVYIVAKCGFIGAEIEAEFMWCLLQPSLLNGEAGYYLTALCSAVHVLKSFITNEQDGTGSVDFRSSSLPACSSVLRVIIPDEYNGSLQTRTLPIRPHTTTREVCRIIAHKARVTNPQDYALFKLVDGQETLLLDSDCPQEARLAARGKPCMLAYKRIEAKIAWPTTSQAFQ